MEKIKRKNWWMVIMGTVLFLGAVLVLNDDYKKFLFRQETVLTIGVFSDSYWEVQNGYSYRILEDAIALFEKEHEGVKVEYVSGILKENYPEWLAEQMILGRGPDLFFIFGEHFNDLAEIGALKDLSKLAERDEDFVQERF